MKIEVKKIDAVRRELKFEIPKDRVRQSFDEIYEDLGKVAKVKGFRQGKIPRNVLEAHHGKLAQEEVIKKLIPEAYHEGIKNENISPMDLPDIDNVAFKDGIITFTATLDIRPDIKIKDYKGIRVKKKSSEVTEEEINKTLEMFKKGQGQNQDVQLDDAFAHGLGYGSLDEFKKSLARQMGIDKERQNRLDIEHQIIEELLKKTKFSVPPSFVNKHLEQRIHETKHRLKDQGASDEDIKKKEEEMRHSLKDSVEKDIRVYLILDKIAEQEKIEVKENEHLSTKVMQLLLKEAKWEEAK